jgi:hypothetical protein
MTTFSTTESGRSFTKQDVIENLESGATRYISMISTGRRIGLLSEDVGIVHGSEDDEIEQGGATLSRQLCLHGRGGEA